MNGNAALRKAKQFITAQGGQVAPLSISEEDLNPDAQEDVSMQVVLLESANSVYDVPYDCRKDSNCSEFRFFEDGRQRTIQIGYIRADYKPDLVLIPVHFFVVAAVILERQDRHLRLWKEPRVDQGIFIARSLVPDQSVLDEFAQSGLSIVDTETATGAGAPMDYYEMRRRALNRAKTHRLALEQQLITEWRGDPGIGDGFLVVDGTLMNIRDERSVERCVGVSRSFGNRYFDIAQHNRIMQMSERQRSWAFRFHDEQDDLREGARERMSWYLRLRERCHGDPEFGLLRIEIAKKYVNEAQVYAERFSRSLLSERFPTAYPTPRWDKHLYPLGVCDSYLSSVVPSMSTITASMRG